MRLKKAPVFIAGFGAIVAAGIGGFASNMPDVVASALSALVWIVGIGLGANVGEAAQRSAFYRPELDKKE